MEYFENLAINSTTKKPTIWLRYVDDTFVIWRHGKEQLKGFLEHLNSIKDNIKFTMEEEKQGQFPFLDALVERVSQQYHTSGIVVKLFRPRHLRKEIVLVFLPPL